MSEEKYQMLIDIGKLDGLIKGIIHIGAHIAEEYESYMSIGCSKIIWVEANSELVISLRDRFKDNEAVQIIEAVIFDKEADMTFKIHNDTHTSSLLEMEKIAENHPELYVEDIKKIKTITLDQLTVNHSINMNEYNMLVVDVQGVELQALKGAVNNLMHFDYILTEVETWELYKGAKNYDKIKDWVSSQGFKVIDEHIRHWGWGDILFKRT